MLNTDFASFVLGAPPALAPPELLIWNSWGLASRERDDGCTDVLWLNLYRAARAPTAAHAIALLGRDLRMCGVEAEAWIGVSPPAPAGMRELAVGSFPPGGRFPAALLPGALGQLGREVLGLLPPAGRRPYVDRAADPRGIFIAAARFDSIVCDPAGARYGADVAVFARAAGWQDALNTVPTVH